MSKQFLIRWTIVLLIPVVTLFCFAVFPAKDATDHLINGIILACEATFLFKFVLFAVIGHHLRQEPQQKKQAYWLFLPIILLISYLVYYFQAI